MFDWLKEILSIRLNYLRDKNRIKYEIQEQETGVEKENTACESCRTLKTQLGIANQEKKDLLDKLINPPVAPVIIKEVTAPKPVGNTVKLWGDRKRILEQNSRREAEILAENSKVKTSNEELEKQIVDANIG